MNKQNLKLTVPAVEKKSCGECRFLLGRCFREKKAKHLACHDFKPRVQLLWTSVENLPPVCLAFEQRACEDTVILKDKNDNQHEVRLSDVLENWLEFRNCDRLRRERL